MANFVAQHRWQRSLPALVCAFLCARTLASAAEPRPADLEFFERHVRPLLVARCLECHGATKQESGLRLDSLEGILKGGERGPAIAPEDVEASRLIHAVRRNGELQMPPEKPLAPADVAVLERWVRLGAPWPKAPSGASAELVAAHWAFQPVRRPPVPLVENSDWPRTPIDHFILARLEAAGLTPSPQIERRPLLRRIMFDLLGLPPAPEDAAAFEADDSPGAFERVVDRLLASPQYGERWGRHWLDVARYADNKGYVFFEDKNYPWAWTYRDYVVAAFNADLPYDRFLLEQLAADQLDLGADKTPLTALGFLTVGAHFMNNTHDIIDDRIDVVTRGLMGLTVTCARCHDHKYDPVPTAEYYGLYGVFRGSYEPLVPPLFTPPPQSDEYRTYAEELAKREQALTDFITEKYRVLVQGARTRVDEYLLAVHERRGRPPADDFMLISDTQDINPGMITRWEAYLEQTATRPHPVWGPWNALAAANDADVPNVVHSLRVWTRDSRSESPTLNALVRAALADPPLATLTDVAKRYGDLFRRIDADWQAALAQAKEQASDPPSALADPAAEELRQELYAADSPPDIPIEMDWGFLSLFPDRPTQEEYKKLLKAVEEQCTAGAAAPPRAMALLDADRPCEPRVFLRGNPNRPGERVPRHMPRVVDPAHRPFTQGSGRLELARSIASPQNPLTARVIVNRLWLHHFGEGLVRTPGDFGLRSEPPTHPELLDWLAAELVDSGWSLKHLQRLMLTSAVYRQSSDAEGEESGVRQGSEVRRQNPEPRATGSAGASVRIQNPKSKIENPESPDPENRLLSHMPRRRLEFEAARDALLSAAGLLDDRVGGPAVDIIGQLSPRRTLYGSIDRMDVPPLLTTFDVPSPSATSPRRETTTVSPQALYYMNHPHIAELSRRIARRADVSALPPDARVDRLYDVLFTRRPDPEERAAALHFLGSAPDDTAWARLVQALVMGNEMAFVD